MIQSGGDPIQAFPLGPGTYVGTPTAMDMDGYSIIHAVEDVQLTLQFSQNNSLVIDVPAGMDVAIDPQCDYLTATGKVWVS